MANWITAAEAITMTGNASITEGNVTMANAAAINFIGRDVAQATTTEFYSGANTPNLPIARYPVTSVTNVWLDAQGDFGQNPNGFGANTLLTVGVGYDLVTQASATNTVGKEGLLRFLQNQNAYGWTYGYFPVGRYNTGPLSQLGKATIFGWPTGAGNIKVTYQAGYATIPDDLKSAVALLAAYYQVTAKYGGLMIDQSGTLGPASYSRGLLQQGGMKTLSPADAILGSAMMLLSKYKGVALGEPL